MRIINHIPDHYGFVCDISVNGNKIHSSNCKQLKNVMMEFYSKKNADWTNHTMILFDVCGIIYDEIQFASSFFRLNGYEEIRESITSHIVQLNRKFHKNLDAHIFGSELYPNGLPLVSVPITQKEFHGCGHKISPRSLKNAISIISSARTLNCAGIDKRYIISEKELCDIIGRGYDLTPYYEKCYSGSILCNLIGDNKETETEPVTWSFQSRCGQKFAATRLLLNSMSPPPLSF